jgi:hypothetical protein
MERATDRYILINETWYRGRAGVIVLNDADTIRIEFVDRY